MGTEGTDRSPRSEGTPNNAPGLPDLVRKGSYHQTAARKPTNPRVASPTWYLKRYQPPFDLALWNARGRTGTRRLSLLLPGGLTSRTLPGLHIIVRHDERLEDVFCTMNAALGVGRESGFLRRDVRTPRKNFQILSIGVRC